MKRKARWLSCLMALVLIVTLTGCQKDNSSDSLSGIETTVLPDHLSNLYADFDNPSFEFNGKLFTLGQFILQDLLNTGGTLADFVSFFEKPQPIDGKEMVNGNWIRGFFVLLDEDHYFSVYVQNTSEEPKSASELTVVGFEISFDEGETFEAIKCACPYNASWQQIIDNSGAAEDISGDETYGLLMYTRKADEHVSYCSYTFSFFNGALDGIDIQTRIE